jgi:hypothetical protein
VSTSFCWTPLRTCASWAGVVAFDEFQFKLMGVTSWISDGVLCGVLISGVASPTWGGVSSPSIIA